MASMMKAIAERVKRYYKKMKKMVKKEKPQARPELTEEEFSSHVAEAMAILREQGHVCAGFVIHE